MFKPKTGTGKKRCFVITVALCWKCLLKGIWSLFEIMFYDTGHTLQKPLLYKNNSLATDWLRNFPSPKDFTRLLIKHFGTVYCKRVYDTRHMCFLYKFSWAVYSTWKLSPAPKYLFICVQNTTWNSDINSTKFWWHLAENPKSQRNCLMHATLLFILFHRSWLYCPFRLRSSIGFLLIS